MNKLASRVIWSRVAALGLCGLLASVIIAVIVLPLLQIHAELNDQVNALEQERATISELAGEEGELRAQLEILDTSAATAGLLPTTSDANLSQAQMIATVTQLAGAAGLRVLSTEAQAPLDNQGLRHLPIQLRVAGPDAAVATFMARAKATKPLLTLQRLSLHTDLSQSPGDNAVQADIVLEALSRQPS